MFDRDRVTQYFSEQFESGESYASIAVARKAIGQELGHKIESETLEGKADDELIELSLVKISRNIVQTDNPIVDFDALVVLYNRQLTLGVQPQDFRCSSVTEHEVL